MGSPSHARITPVFDLRPQFPTSSHHRVPPPPCPAPWLPLPPTFPSPPPSLLLPLSAHQLVAVLDGSTVELMDVSIAGGNINTTDSKAAHVASVQVANKQLPMGHVVPALHDGPTPPYPAFSSSAPLARRQITPNHPFDPAHKPPTLPHTRATTRPVSAWLQMAATGTSTSAAHEFRVFEQSKYALEGDKSRSALPPLPRLPTTPDVSQRLPTTPALSNTRCLCLPMSPSVSRILPTTPTHQVYSLTTSNYV